MLNVKELNKDDKELLFAIKKVDEIVQSWDHDATTGYIVSFSKVVKNACDLMEQFNHNIFLFLDIDDVRRLLNMYVNSNDYEDRLLLSDIIVNKYINKYYYNLYDYLEKNQKNVDKK